MSRFLFNRSKSQTTTELHVQFSARTAGWLKVNPGAKSDWLPRLAVLLRSLAARFVTSGTKSQLMKDSINNPAQRTTEAAVQPGGRGTIVFPH